MTFLTKPDDRFRATCYKAAVVSAIVVASYNPATAAVEDVVRSDPSNRAASGYRSAQQAASRQPQLADIDAAYNEIELTDEQADALLAQRASGAARATIPLVRFARP